MLYIKISTHMLFMKIVHHVFLIRTLMHDWLYTNLRKLCSALRCTLALIPIPIVCLGLHLLSLHKVGRQPKCLGGFFCVFDVYVRITIEDFIFVRRFILKIAIRPILYLEMNLQCLRLCWNLTNTPRDFQKSQCNHMGTVLNAKSAVIPPQDFH